MAGMPAAAKQAVEERVSFENQSKETLVGVLNEATSADTIILCHGYADTKNGFHLPVLAQALADNGYSSLRFDFCGNGESEGDFRYGNYVKEAGDVHSAVKWLHTKGKTVKGILGHSKGGDTVLVYAARYDDVPKVINCSARFWLRDGITPRFGKDIFERLEKEKSIEMKNNPLQGKVWTLTQEDMEERLCIDMAQVGQSIHNSQVLTIHGVGDTTIPYTDAEELDKYIKHHKLHLIEGANHNFTDPEHAQELIQTVLAFLSDT